VPARTSVVGLFFADLGVGLVVRTGNSVFDAVASILIGLLLAAVSLVLAREVKSLLIGDTRQFPGGTADPGGHGRHSATTTVVSHRRGKRSTDARPAVSRSYHFYPTRSLHEGTGSIQALIVSLDLTGIPAFI
jgi:hypothetical protein